MAKTIEIAGETYSDVPSIEVPKSGGGTASFIDTSGATASASTILNGYTAYINGSLVTGTATQQGVSVVTSTDAAGGTIYEITGNIIDYRGLNFEYVQDLGTLNYTLSSDTSWNSWTPVTNQTSIKATTNLTTFSAAMADYDYIIRWWYVCDVALNSGATLARQLAKQVNILDNVIYRRPSDLSNIISGNYNVSVVQNYNVAICEYYNSSGTLVANTNTSYGIYPSASSPSFSSTTSNTPTVTVKTPIIYARCSDTYMSTARAGEINSTNTTISLIAKLYRCTKGSSFIYRSYEDVVNYFKGVM